jgi:hypothetical protein
VAKAVRVTVEPTMVGIVDGPGTLKIVGAPEAECGGAPQLTPPQLAFQSTPRLAGSPVTVAATVTVPNAGAIAGAGSVMVTPVTVPVMLTVTEENLLWSVADTAVTVTVAFEGTAAGAVKVVAPPFGVCAGVKEPQLADTPDVSVHTEVQFTPAFAVSLLTLAVSCALEPTGIEAGGICVMATEMSGVCVGPFDDTPLALPFEHPAIPQNATRLSPTDRSTWTMLRGRRRVGRKSTPEVLPWKSECLNEAQLILFRCG